MRGPRRRLSRATSLASIAVAATVAACAMPPSEDDLASVAQAIVGGSSTARDDAVVALMRAGRPYCTGTLVAPRVVLTAAHCATERAEPEAVFFGNEVALGGTTIDVLAVERHPTFVDGPTPVDDVALLQLARDAEVTPVRVNVAPLEATRDVGRAVRIVGFGHAEVGGTIGVKRTGSTRVAAVTRTSFTLDASGARTCVGDSGGPSLVELDDGSGEERVAGIHSFGDETCEGIALDARVDAYADAFVLGAIDRLDGSDERGCTVGVARGARSRPGAAPDVPWLALFFAAATIALRRRRFLLRSRSRCRGAG